MVEQRVYRELGLTDPEYQRIEGLLKREPSPTELAMFSVEWSEHCGYSRSRKLLKRLPRKGKYPIIVGEDAGGIYVDDLAVIFKMESHNHPSQVEPKQGAATGVGGIIRDIFTTGARPIASLNSLRFGPLTEPFNRYIFSGVVDGIQSYGNCIGVPTVAGEIYFEEAYAGNCLVNAMSIGVCRKDEIAKAQAKGEGNIVIYAGSRTGRDGIGGCSVLASAEFCEDEEKRPTVQIGDPFTEKCLIEATLEALKTGYVVGVKDMGAAGLTCSTSEMALAGGVGMEVDLSLVPLRDESMEPFEIMMSESQEREVLCVKVGHENEIIDIFKKWGLQAVPMGKVLKEKILRIHYKGKLVVEVKPEDLAKAPIYDLPTKEPDYIPDLRKLDASKIQAPKDLNEVLLKLLSSPNIANKSYVYEQYDHMVQTNTAVLPGSDAAVLRLKGTKKGIAATTDCSGRYCYINPHVGASIAIAEAARNLVCAGAEPAGVTDCLNFANPDKPERYWEFKGCMEGIIEACEKLNLPVVSGNVSFYNESPAGPIYPTPTIGMVGVVNDMEKICSSSFKNSGDVIILLGDNKEELGASEYLKVIHNMVKGDVPVLDLKGEKAVQSACLEAIQKGLVNSAHDCSEGGLAVALAECCISGNELIGAKIEIKSNVRADALLFGESQSRIIVSCSSDKQSKVEKILKKHNVPYQIIGKVGGKELKINNLIRLPIDSVYSPWKSAIPRLMGLA
jgi:phosphoribosylformylglycinamidine synthase